MTTTPYLYKDGFPGHAPSQTSVDAARAILPHAPELERQALALLIAAGPAGYTDEELDHAAGTEATRTMRPRRCSLVAQGFVVDSGLRRRGARGRAATVWVAVVRGGQGALL